jgi:hypothetical protein
VDRLQAAATDSRSVATALVAQSTAPAASSSSGGGGTVGDGSSGFRLLASQPEAVGPAQHDASGVSALSSSGGSEQRRHVEGGLLISAALLGSGGDAASSLASSSRQGSLSRAPSPLGGSSSGLSSSTHAVSATALSGVRTSYSSLDGAAGPPSTATPPAAASSIAAGVRGSSGSIAAGVGGSSGSSAAGVSRSRRQLVAWLRAALDVLAAVAAVDPAAVLTELSHKLAGEAVSTWCGVQGCVVADGRVSWS